MTRPASASGGRVVQRTIFPIDRDIDALPLYVDTNQVVTKARAATKGYDVDSSARGARGAEATVGASTAAAPRPDQVRGRGSLTVPAGTRASMATYFNALPASYWRRWTDVEEVVLRVRTSGDATVVVYRSTAKGHLQRIHSELATGDGHLTEVRLSIAPFADGGWCWYDVVAGQQEDAVLESGEWLVDDPPSHRGTVTVGITTFNRPTYCMAQLRTLGEAKELEGVLDQIVVVDQGTDRVRDQPGFDDVAARLGERLKLVEQANLGGSGGFARAMLETSERGRSDYVLLLDDDVVSEPAGIARAVTFADLCREPTIVGGHMFSLYERSVLHTTGEAVDRWRFAFEPTRTAVNAHDFATQSLRATAELHRRTDVEYNGWWMCLIPVDVVRRVGLSMPYFIKWDDAEYGLRAGREGVPTVTLPGAAVWHMPFTDKDDTIDWQAYYHLRNRLVAALIYSPYDLGGRLINESFAHQVKHLVAMQYSVAELRLLAIEDVLSGPEHLHATIATRLGEIHAVRKQHSDARHAPSPTAFPAPHRPKPPRRGRAGGAPSGTAALVLSAVKGVARQALPVERTARELPQEGVAAMDARWFNLAQLDSAVVTTADGTKVSWYRRDRKRFAELIGRSLEAHQELYRRWAKLREGYREAQPELVSPEAWKQTFTSTTPSA